MAGKPVDSGDDRFDDEISKCLLNRRIVDSPAEISISSKIRILGCLPDGQARCMTERAADSGGGCFDGEISNYLLNMNNPYSIVEISISSKIRILGCLPDGQARAWPREPPIAAAIALTMK